MALKALTSAGTMVALLASSAAFAAPLNTGSAKDALKIAQMSRARSHMNRNKSNKVINTNYLDAGVVVVGVLGIAAAAGAFNSSN